MSFILESLQRVQRDRRKGQAPDLEQAYRDRAILPPRKRRWPWVIALVLVVSGGVAGYLVWPKSSGSDAGSTPPAKMQETAAPGEQTLPAAALPPAPPPAPKAPPAAALPPAPPLSPKSSSRGCFVARATSHAAPKATSAAVSPSPAPMALPPPPAVSPTPKTPDSQSTSNTIEALPIPVSEEGIPAAAPGKRETGSPPAGPGSQGSETAAATDHC